MFVLDDGIDVYNEDLFVNVNLDMMYNFDDGLNDLILVDIFVNIKDVYGINVVGIIVVV